MKKSNFVIPVLLVVFSIGCAQDYDEEFGQNEVGADTLAFTTDWERNNWMSHINDDSRQLRNINIPGAHQSGTWDLGTNLNWNYAKCQDWTVGEQLYNGIRFLDVESHCEGSSTALKLSHGQALGDEWLGGDYLLKVYNFLNNRDEEFVIVRIRYNGETSCPTYDKSYRLTHYLSTYYENQLGGTIVDYDYSLAGRTIGTTRGKLITLLDGWGTIDQSIRTNYWGQSFMDHFSYYCDYCPWTDTATRALDNINDVRAASQTSGPIYITGLEGLKLIDVTPRGFADDINPWIYNEIDLLSGRFGIIKFDFVDDHKYLIDEIIGKNPN